MLIPYIDTWPQVCAASCRLLPQNLNFKCLIFNKQSFIKNDGSKKEKLCCLCLLCLCRPWASYYCHTTSPTAWSTCPRWWMTSGTTQAIARQTWVASLISLATVLLSLVCSSTCVSSLSQMKWYTRRAALTGIFNTTELVMVQDSSPDFEETWAFLDNRIKDVVNMANTAKQVNWWKADKTAICVLFRSQNVISDSG